MGGDFTLRSCGDPKESLDLAAELHETRASLTSFLPERPERDRVPFTAYLFCRGGDFMEFAPSPGQGNHFVASLRGDARVENTYETKLVSTRTTVRGTRVAVPKAQLELVSNLVRHHYVHHLVRAHLEVPLWVEEGVAGYLGTITREPTGVRRGRTPNGMLRLDQLDTQVALGRVFRATGLRTWPDRELLWFYRSSGLTVHYL